MAISAIAGLASAAGAYGAALAAGVAFTTTAFATAFAIGAGLSIISRALMPKPDFGGMMQGVTGTVREATASRKVIYGQVRVGGAVVFIANSNQNKYLYLVICVACHEVEAYQAVFFNDEKVWENGSYISDWGSYANIAFYDGSQTTADTMLVSASAFWTSTHVLNGIAYLRVRLEWDEDRKKFPQGVPNISVRTAGKALYDPRKDSTAGGSGSHRTNDPSTWEYSQNPALALYDYFTNSFYGLGESHDAMDYTAWTDAADVCDESVSLDAGGSHARYQCDGVIDTANNIKGNIEALTSCMGGRVGYVDGKYFLQAAKYYAPTITIDESHMVGTLSVQTKQSRRSGYNAVKGVFLSEEENYTLVDYPAKISSTYSAQDGDPIYLDMPLPFVTNNIRAQRLAKIALLKSRQQVLVTVPLNLTALKFKAGDFIGITNSRMGWTNKPFEVLGYDLQIGNEGAIIVNVQAIETDSSVYDWTASADEDPFNEPNNPTTNDGTTVAAPTNLVLTETTTFAGDGSLIDALKVSWDASADGFIEYYEVVITEVDTGTTWTVTTRETSYLVTPIIKGVNYSISVIAVNVIGVRSTALTGTLTPVGDTTAPAVPTNVAAVGEFKSITLSWTNPSDEDLRWVDVYKAAEANQAYSYIASVRVAPDGSGLYVDQGLAYGEDYFYKLKALDSSGNASAFSAVASATTDTRAESNTPRELRGYVYYTNASATDPGTPSATSFDFDNDAFVNLTSGWSLDPPEQTGADGTYWAARFQVLEDDYDGNQTVSFSDAFESFIFNGLVTFTNLNTELGDPASAKITTIDGGLIKTGVVDLANEDGMAIRQGKTAAGTAGTGFWIGNNSGTAQFWMGDPTNYVYWNGGALVARQLEVRNSADAVILTSGGEFDGTYIQDLSVDTLAVAGEAITAPRQNSGSSNKTHTSSETQLASINFTIGDLGGASQTAGVIVLGVASCTSSNTDETSVRLRIRKGTTLIDESGATWKGDGITVTVLGKSTIAQNTTETFYLYGSVDSLSGGQSTKAGNIAGSLLIMVGKR